jgi:hypothetical protein
MMKISGTNILRNFNSTPGLNEDLGVDKRDKSVYIY